MQLYFCYSVLAYAYCVFGGKRFQKSWLLFIQVVIHKNNLFFPRSQKSIKVHLKVFFIRSLILKAQKSTQNNKCRKNLLGAKTPFYCYSLFLLCFVVLLYCCVRY